ncbi:alpha-1,4-glucan--maltose-1-phosphate maltosyltransferase [Corynebacterium sp. CCM 8835]|uniref:Alpha-1,4-glucan:maltose-1-phosphate maltosyltransferase n=1 Tax=Corynebacterium antarcticum TaxID=2800405 RepID=A0ABS1FLS8_9CORY|nr:alpha-1,4-glucan--maltose-1-phosphate maltosyltransferase [Corynebacterium antarcticum]MCK7643010.1 alpha-1,4-glucan--maltose-1-phosphate maltosyltransferase [Corynebacterium antarcticum]MCK7661513.1 alpha-1,4-glucan--maltose-1-phosphate maltosyltransferase [Corynebacterium antarcticum]MCL0246256.1 alpha-1,4-glucan--maltose-1-phosphate maltosyltransferase [Corynebacterium antarcticum]MCX7492507.1 alpha-1,4-glucan--maltose-1-phosphate maltosyltransferase [Corynebacterium antarcticum]MCX75408
MTNRLGLDDVRPVISGGRHPTKAVVGEVVPISGLAWREGHDAISATLNVRGPEASPGFRRTVRIPMHTSPHDEDQVNAVVIPDAPGTWTFRIDVWSDPVATWRHAVTSKIDAGQTRADLANDLEIGARLFLRAAEGAPKKRRPEFTSVVDSLRREDISPAEAVAPAFEADFVDLLDSHPLRGLLTRGITRKIKVERPKALFSSWYEFFPRSTGGVDEDGRPVHGTFATATAELDRVAGMGFDTVYFPPIHPIGEINRKGRNNTLTPTPEDVGSPWAIGSTAGGHDAVHPALGTIDDFDALVSRAEELGLEVALDLALQCAPDHPWAAEHPEWFTVLPDGTIAYAENPPKKYQDIYPLNFDNDPDGLYREVLRVVLFWVGHGVTTFRVDNPHTKPANFWEWLINAVHEKHPEVIFLAEAFTRRPRLYGLAKAGFSQSYTYFTWQTTKRELTEFGEEISRMADVCRPNLFVNTPDILHASLQYGGRGMFALRAVLAATMSPLWGVYSGYELYEHRALKPGSEEYLDSEKFELRPRDYAAAEESGDSLSVFIGTLNRVRREHPALQQLRILDFHATDSDQIIAYSKVDPVSGDAVLVVVNLDPYNAVETTVHLDLERLGLDPGAMFDVHDEISGADYLWGEHNYVRLEPWNNVAHLLILPTVDPERREQLAWRRIDRYRA